MPLPLACALYGVLLGLGFTTFVLAFAVWALAGISFAAGDPLLGAIIGARVRRRARAARAVDGAGLARRARRAAPRRDGRRAAAVAGTSPPRRARAAPVRARARRRRREARRRCRPPPTLPRRRESWPGRQPGGPGMLLALAGSGGAGALSARASSLPGEHPAIGGSLVAWTGAGEIVVADRATLTPRLTLAAPGVNALAVSNSWLVFRDLDAAGARTTDRRVAAGAAAAPLRVRMRGSRGRSAGRRSTKRRSCSRSARRRTARSSWSTWRALACARCAPWDMARRCRTRRCSAGGCCSIASRAALSSCGSGRRSRTSPGARAAARRESANARC